MMNKYQTQLGKFWAKDLGPFRENGLDQDGVPTMKFYFGIKKDNK